MKWWWRVKARVTTQWWAWRHRKSLTVHTTDRVPVDSSDWVGIRDIQRLRPRTPLEALAFRAMNTHNRSNNTAIVRLMKITPDED